MPSKKKARPTRANVAPPVGNAGNKEKNSVRRKREPSQKQLDALRAHQFKPGESGNLSGRPKSPFADTARRVAERIVKADKEHRTYVELAIIGMFNEAIRGNVQAFSALADRTEGKPMQPLQHSGPGGGAIPITSLSPEENEKRIAELMARYGKE